MPSSMNPVQPSGLRLLEELPGIADVMWATVTRFASSRVPTGVPTRIVFTAAEQRAGTTVLAAATAISLARNQRIPVCLLETNLRRPALAEYLGLETVGLSDILDGRAELEDCLQEPRGCPGLLVLPAGTPREPAPGEFTIDRLSATLTLLEQRCHYLILDAAPVLEHLESRLLLRHADAALLVLRARATRRSDAERTHDILVASGTPVLGSIFNDYRAEGLFGGSGRASRAFEKAVRAERRRANVSDLAPGAPAASVGGAAAAEPRTFPAATNGGSNGSSNGGSNGGNGHSALVPPAPAVETSESTYRRQIDILERRVVKLTQQLEQTEADLRRIAAMKNVDLGIASIFRGVQGLSPGDEAQAHKRFLLRELFRANLDLKAAIARHPSFRVPGLPGRPG